MSMKTLLPLIPATLVVGLVAMVIWSSAKQDDMCASILIQKGAQLYLYNPKRPEKDPIIFEDRNEYLKFVQWQNKQGIHCPVLYAQQMYDAQRNKAYQIHPSVADPQGGLSAHVYRPIVSVST